MRPRFVASLALPTFLALGACGGSSSETPPPLQPDPKGFHYASAPPPASLVESDAGAPAPTSEPEEEKPRAPRASDPSRNSGRGATKPQ